MKYQIIIEHFQRNNLRYKILLGFLMFYLFLFFISGKSGFSDTISTNNGNNNFSTSIDNNIDSDFGNIKDLGDLQKVISDPIAEYYIKEGKVQNTLTYLLPHIKCTNSTGLEITNVFCNIVDKKGYDKAYNFLKENFYIKDNIFLYNKNQNMTIIQGKDNDVMFQISQIENSSNLLDKGNIIGLKHNSISIYDKYLNGNVDEIEKLSEDKFIKMFFSELLRLDDKVSYNKDDNKINLNLDTEVLFPYFEMTGYDVKFRKLHEINGISLYGVIDSKNLNQEKNYINSLSNAIKNNLFEYLFIIKDEKELFFIKK